MICHKITVESAKGENRSIGRFEGDECVSRFQRTHTISFRLYPIACYTGVCANGAYEQVLQRAIIKYLKRFGSRSNYRVGRLREGYGKCPQFYSCKYFELPIYIKTANASKDRTVWIENEF